MIRINKLLKLSPWDWVMLVMAYRWLIWAKWQMSAGRLVGWEWLEGDRRRGAMNVPGVEDADGPRIRRRVRLISVAARYPRRWSWCLQSSLALREWLVQSNVFADLRIGVQKCDGRLQAHAWLEYQGEVLNDSGSEVESYVALQTDRGKLLSRLSDVGQERVQ